MRVLVFVVIVFTGLGLAQGERKGRPPEFRLPMGASEIELDALRRIISDTNPDWLKQLRPERRRIIRQPDVVLIVFERQGDWRYCTRYARGIQTSRAKPTESFAVLRALEDSNCRNLTRSLRLRCNVGVDLAQAVKVTEIVVRTSKEHSKPWLALLYSDLLDTPQLVVEAWHHGLKEDRHGSLLVQSFEQAHSLERKRIESLDRDANSGSAFAAEVAAYVASPARRDTDGAVWPTWHKHREIPGLFVASLSGGFRCYLRVSPGVGPRAFRGHFAKTPQKIRIAVGSVLSDSVLFVDSGRVQSELARMEKK